MSDTAISNQRDTAAFPEGGMGSARDFFELLKPRVMSLVIFTALVGIAVAPGGIHPVIAFTALLCIAVGAGASGALNMWYDADIDARMARTANRPIPAGRVTAREAAVFGSILSVFAVMTMGVLVNWVAAALLAFTIFFYLVVYTMWLKRRTPQNIVIGGAAGAFPPMIGWAAVTGSVSIEPFVLFLIIFMWTPPHFWALALYRSGDYEKVGVPMLPVVSGEKETRRQIMLYSLALVPVTLLPGFLGFAGALYMGATAALGAGFLWLAFGIWRTEPGAAQDKAAKRLFGYSILYLFLIFSLLLVEKMLGLGGTAFALAL
ncbi:protoheme IX farnesyltransferase [Parvibaculum lavamentivorans DS-1]|uniref:Protoheme IX farnesyltransferase n=1 Tax=Parvibaculum lavamentivorans (strain DS-1 / DSM 13023 / NCIMB 13966) TaxID=402881 RepID=COXX_PARL1|nr:heme o synthase [Parvibaculum lavamentivorans]A7HQW1.1 RecName: Full=Protoheme IX farnesyltransferase; AltName: Full=Heme B farnesyltransferase; AltName: Full=Heme O synthase [Parvibaculum lavamentivorans DS-1]ABS62294.1 protoheme IX farnesyltransferase [Parvibaculum lavamentivorans DS-1]